MKRRKLVETGWRQYVERVLPTNAPRVQIVECRRAYYAGAYHLLSSLTSEAGGDEVSEDDGVSILQSVATELNQFVEDVMGGRK